MSCNYYCVCRSTWITTTRAMQPWMRRSMTYRWIVTKTNTTQIDCVYNRKLQLRVFQQDIATKKDPARESFGDAPTTESIYACQYILNPFSFTIWKLNLASRRRTTKQRETLYIEHRYAVPTHCNYCTNYHSRKCHNQSTDPAAEPRCP